MVPVVSETYDEAVFTNPKIKFFRQMQLMKQPSDISAGNALDCYSQSEHFGEFSDTADALALIEAQKFLQDQLAAVKTRFRFVNAEMKQVDEEIVEQSAIQQRIRQDKSNTRKQQQIAGTSTATSGIKRAKTKSTSAAGSSRLLAGAKKTAQTKKSKSETKAIKP